MNRSPFAAQPLLASRLILQLASPFARSLGIELLEWGGGRAVTRMKASSRTARSTNDPRPHPYALVGIVDDAFSQALASVLPGDVGMSTLDLRIAFAAAHPVEGDVTTEIHAMMLDPHAGEAEVLVQDADGRIIASGSALFNMGGFPGGDSTPSFDRVGQFDPTPLAGPFTHMAGLEEEEGGIALREGNEALIGWESGAKLHGGAIGALLMAACEQRVAMDGDNGKRLASLAIRYMRPGEQQRLHATARFERRGRGTSFVDAVAFHEAGRPVATAHATFVRS